MNHYRLVGQHVRETAHAIAELLGTEAARERYVQMMSEEAARKRMSDMFAGMVKRSGTPYILEEMKGKKEFWIRVDYRSCDISAPYYVYWNGDNMEKLGFALLDLLLKSTRGPQPICLYFTLIFGDTWDVLPIPDKKPPPVAMDASAEAQKNVAEALLTLDRPPTPKKRGRWANHTKKGAVTPVQIPNGEGSCSSSVSGPATATISGRETPGVPAHFVLQ